MALRAVRGAYACLTSGAWGHGAWGAVGWAPGAGKRTGTSAYGYSFNALAGVTLSNRTPWDGTAAE